MDNQNITEDYGTIISRLWELREERRKIAKLDDELKEEFDELKRNLISNMESDCQGIKTITTTIARVTITKRTVVQTNDKDNFIEYVASNKAWHLLNFSPKSTACIEAITALGEAIPSIELITLTDLSITTVK